MLLPIYDTKWCPHKMHMAVDASFRKGLVPTADLAGFLDGNVDIILEDPISKVVAASPEASRFGCLHHLLNPGNLLHTVAKQSNPPFSTDNTHATASVYSSSLGPRHAWWGVLTPALIGQKPSWAQQGEGQQRAGCVPL